MISKDEIVKSVAQSCGVSIEISSFFFEVFINRLSNKLKPGDLLHFHNFGYFHKRNCRIQIEKTSDSPTPKSYLIQLVLFSSETKIKSDLGEVQFLKIPNLKTLWVDDKEFQKSLNAGDFSPYTDRNQLIKSFATKAEVIISSLRKDYDSELVEELIIPLTFDLNFLVQSGKKSKSKTKFEQKSFREEQPDQPKVEEKTVDSEKLKNGKDTKDELPWNYGTKFLEKDKSVTSIEVDVSETKTVQNEQRVSRNPDSELRKNQASRLKDFEPVTSHRLSPSDESTHPNEPSPIKFSVSPVSVDDSDRSNPVNKFTEVKAKTESYRRSGNFGKTKNKYDRYSFRKNSKEKAFTDRRNYLPIIALVSFIIIAVVVVYIYFIEGNGDSRSSITNMQITTPPKNINVINRDFQFLVSYPYPKLENRINISGFSEEMFVKSDIKPETNKETNKETKPEIKIEPKNEIVTGLNEKPKQEIKTVPPVEIKPEPVVEKKETISRIFLYKNFYVVNVGSFKSEEAADREADKYFGLGYNAIIEVTETREGTRLYRLNVGDFTSEDFARQFQEKYIK